MTTDSHPSQETTSDASLSTLLQGLGDDVYKIGNSLMALIANLRDENRPHMFGLLNMRLCVVASEIAHQREPSLTFNDQQFVAIKNQLLQQLQEAIAREDGGDTLVEGMNYSALAESRAREELIRSQGNNIR